MNDNRRDDGVQPMRASRLLRFGLCSVLTCTGTFVAVMSMFSDRDLSADWTRPDGSIWSVGACYRAINWYRHTTGQPGYFTDTGFSVTLGGAVDHDDCYLPFDEFGEAVVSALGVKYFSYSFITARRGLPSVTERSQAIVVPDWLLVPTLFAFPAFALRGALRRRWRQRHGCCVTCGYDLRASDGRCPECGGQQTRAMMISGRKTG